MSTLTSLLRLKSLLYLIKTCVEVTRRVVGVYTHVVCVVQLAAYFSHLSGPDDPDDVCVCIVAIKSRASNCTRVAPTFR